MATYFTSDLHLGCENALLPNVGNRPFESLDEMHDYIIKKWNGKVTNSDDVYILGDVGRRGFEGMRTDILCQLKGRLHLIIGNHDDVSDIRVQKQFVEIVSYKEVFIHQKVIDKEGRKGTITKTAVLSHYPILMWNKQHRGSILLYGHLHNTREEDLFQSSLKAFYKQSLYDHPNDIPYKAYNVGCMLYDYTPVSFDEIEERYNRLSNDNNEIDKYAILLEANSRKTFPEEELIETFTKK